MKMSELPLIIKKELVDRLSERGKDVIKDNDIPSEEDLQQAIDTMTENQLYVLMGHAIDIHNLVTLRVSMEMMEMVMGSREGMDIPKPPSQQVPKNLLN
jgi:hypothetical protein